MTTTANQNYNLKPIDLSVNDNTDPNRYFNNYSDAKVSVSPNVDAAVLGYFEEVSDNPETAKALASAVIYTAQSQGLDVMTTLQQFMELDQGELSAYLVMFLNLQRKGTSYLGINNQPITNKYITRAILA
jgi:hypothetical protein